MADKPASVRTGAPARSQVAVFAKRVRDFMQPAILSVGPQDATGHVIAQMGAAGRSSVIVVDDAGRVAGILTERDVTRRIALHDVHSVPVEKFATRPVLTVGSDDYLYRAVARMRRHNLRHMPVVDGTGAPVGMINLIDAVAVVAAQSLGQLDRLTQEPTVEGLSEVKAAQADIARELMADNLRAPEILALITDINRDIHRQVLDGAIRAQTEAGWGDPPVPITLLLMGSGGRGENFLAPDQDNGFILADYPDAEHDRIDAYFVALAERFNADLDRIGFPLCMGNVMARNPVWRKTASQWREQVAMWARRRSPVAVLFADIFFDFLPIAGPGAPAEELRRHVGDVLKTYPALLAMMCAEETNKSVALGMFGGLRAESSGPDRGRADLKLRGTMPLVASARLWALKEGVAATSTLARLGELGERGIVGRDDLDALSNAVEQVTFCLLRQQLDDIEAGGKPGNLVDLRRLLRREREELRGALRAIERFRKETRAAFVGGVF